MDATAAKDSKPLGILRVDFAGAEARDPNCGIEATEGKDVVVGDVDVVLVFSVFSGGSGNALVWVLL